MATAVGRTHELDDGVVRTEGPGGSVLLSETIPGARSATVGVWVKWGSAHEPARRQGIAHLLEHMVFKGTERRAAREIAAAIEGLGGNLDACTGREQTLYQARVPAEHLGVAVDVLADLVFRPLLRAEDLELERKVVLEEIAGVEDTPDDLIFDLHTRAVFGDHPYGSPILGRRETVRAVGRGDLVETWAEAYRPGRCLVVAAGRLEHEALVEEVTGAFPEDGGPPPTAAEVAAPPAGARAREERLARETAQVHLCVGGPTAPDADPRRPALEVALAALGGGMSSRLFQRVREELGLAYAIYSYHSFYRRGGHAGVYAGTQSETADRTLDAIREELARMAAEPLPAAELAATRNQLKGQRLLALESTTARMYRLAHHWLYDEPYESIDDALARIDAVDAEQVRAVCETFLAPDALTVVRLGPTDSA